MGTLDLKFTPALFGRRAAAGILAALTAAAMVLVVAPTPGLANSMDELENLGTVKAVGTTGFTPSARALPAVESLLERGSSLASAATVDADPAAGQVTLGAAAVTATAALVRVTLLEPQSDTLVLTTASRIAIEDDGNNGADPTDAIALAPTNTPILRAAAGATVSTTVLLPVANGAVPLHASSDSAPVRIETLATFASTHEAPGATLALAVPELRADTSQHLGGAQLEPAGMWVGLAGAGAVSSTHARSVYVTLDVTLDAADTVTLSDGQQLALPAGQSIVTTIVAPDAQGGVRIATESATGALRASVLGWVVDVGEDAESANVTGSFVNGGEPARAIQLAGDAPAVTVSMTDLADANYALALVAATVSSGSAAAETTTIDARVPFSGRAAGIAVDAAGGATAQLAFVPVTDGDASFSLRRSAAAVTVQPLGAFLGEPAPYDRETPASIKITSPKDLASINLTETGYFTLEGVADAGVNSIDRIEIAASGDGVGNIFIGTAELGDDPDGVSWSMRVLAPEDGDFNYTATVFDRAQPGKARASDNLTLTIDAAEAGDTVTSPEVHTYGAKPGEIMPSVVDERTLVFAEQPELEPGQIVVTGPLVGAEGGFMGRVSQINHVAGEWLVTTVEAALSDVFFQADVSESIDYDTPEEAALIDVLDVPNSGVDADEFIEGSFTPDGGDTVPLEDYSVEAPDGLGSAGDETALAEWPGTLPNNAHATLLTGDDVDLTLGADDFNLADAGLDPNNPDDFALACRQPGSDGQEPIGDDINDDGEWVPSGTTPGGPTTCDNLRAAVDIHKTWSVGMDASFIVGLKNGKPSVINGTKLDPWEFERAEKRELASTAAIGVQASGEAELSLDFVLKVQMKWKWKVIPAGIKVEEFTNKVTTTLKASAGLKAYFEVAGKLNVKLDVAEVALPTTMFMVGPVPVAITNRLNFAIALNGSIQAEVALPAVGVERVDTFGFSWKTGQGVQRIKNDTPTKYVTPTLSKLQNSATVSLKGNLSVGPEVSYRSRIYTFAGPDIALSAQAGVGGEVTSTTSDLRHYKASLQVYLEFGLEGMLKLTLIKWELVNVSLFKIGTRMNLFSKDWEFSI